MIVSGSLMCPRCDTPIIGSVTIVPGVAPMLVKTDGTVTRFKGTEIFWDEERNVSDSEDALWVQCVNGHEWVVKIISK